MGYNLCNTLLSLFRSWLARTPEYLGKKIEAFEMKMAILAVLAPSIVINYFRVGLFGARPDWRD